MRYPKILIIGQYFNTASGGGITMTNLFKGWDKENIAVAAESISNADFTVCNKYYQLGSLEIKRRFPFNLNPWKKAIPSGAVPAKKIPAAAALLPDPKKGVPGNSFLLYLRLLHFTGLYHYKSRYRISSKFLSWIREYSPDIIYSQLSTIELIGLVSDLHKKLNVPVAVHIMDDWPLTITKKGIFQSYWQKNINNQFRKLLEESKVLLSISEAMSKEYKIRYGYNFIPFHNPIDIKFWSLCSKTDYELKDRFVILYAGRIGMGIQNCFLDIAEAIKNLISKGLKIELHIQATNFNPVLDELAKFDFIKLHASVPYSELPAIFSKSDLLLLPNDFDRKSVSFLKYSMPTKASEYMASGTPVLLYSSVETAVTRNAIKYQWAYVVSEKDTGKLESAIFELYEKKELRVKLAHTAKEYAVNHFESGKIREQFINSLMAESA
jgi:glycosyltransferase involved in cell wall biosynthesis